MERDYRAAARVFKALCDPKRLAILEELRGGEKCACVLQEPMELTQSGLSYHMKVLCESGLVESRQEGKWTHYQLSRTGREYAVKLLDVDFDKKRISLSMKALLNDDAE